MLMELAQFPPITSRNKSKQLHANRNYYQGIIDSTVSFAKQDLRELKLTPVSYNKKVTGSSPMSVMANLLCS